MAKARLAYKGAPVSNTLGLTLSSGATSITLASTMTGWPTSSNPFFIVVDPGTSKEEKICVVYNTTTTLTVVDPAVTSGWSASANGRGADDTTDRSHDAGATVYPVFTAREANQANELTSAYTANGDIVVHGSTSFKKIAVGTNNYTLLADSSVSDGGVKWGQIVEASIATGAVTADKLGTGAVTSAKILDGTIALGDLATVLQNALPPVGTIVAYGGSSAPTGWLVCDGSTFNATTYSSLNTVLGGNTLPDLRARVPMGKAASGTGSTLLGTGGNRKIASNHLPTHQHTINHDHGAFNTNGSDGTHTHTFSGTTGSTTQAATQGFAGTGAAAGFMTNTNIDAVSSTANLSSHDHSFSGTTTSTGSGHAHSIDVPAFTGDSGNGGFANDDYYQPFVAVNYIIKHDYV